MMIFLETGKKKNSDIPATFLSALTQTTRSVLQLQPTNQSPVSVYVGVCKCVYGGGQLYVCPSSIVHSACLCCI